MPSALPVPSKGALRALRNIALGTSCTVAFSAGMLTEDRRRRIRGARLVYDNAKKLKSSKQYHESNAHLAETCEEQVLRYKDDAFWQASSTASTNPPNSEVVDAGDQTPSKTVEPVDSIPPHVPFKPPRIREIQIPGTREKLEQAFTGIDEDRQLRLANDIRQILGNGHSAVIQSAVRRFLEAFEEGLDIESGGIQSCLLEAAIELSTACRTLSMVEDLEPILDIILKSTTLSETDFKRFEPHVIIESLLKSPVDEANMDDYLCKLRKASALCLTEFKNKPGPIPNKMKPLILEACNLTCQFNMYDLTKQLFWRIEATRGKSPNRAVGSFIIAGARTNQHRSAMSQFFRFFVKISPSQEELYIVTDALVESALELKHFDKAEKVLIEASKLTKDGRLLRSNNWFQKLLSTEWRRKRNIRAAQERFNRLKIVIPVICRLEVAYAVIIQICTEAKEFAAAGKYHEELCQMNGSCEDDILIRGQIARGNAMCEQWDDVRANFAEMAKLKPDKKIYGDIFPPILKLFAKSHPVAETEQFLRCFLDDYQVPLTPYASNIMIGEYAKAKELRSIVRWLEYATSVSTIFNADSFNTILSQLYKTWNFNFEEVFEVHRAMLKSSVEYANDFTFAQLRQFALKDSKGDQELAAKKLKVLPRETRTIKDNDYPRRQIFEELGKGNFQKVVRIYEIACQKGVYIHASVLGATVRASLHLHDGDTHMAMDLLRDAKQKDYPLDNALMVLLTHRIPKFMESVGSSRLVKFMGSAREAIAAAEKNGITIPGYVFNEVTEILVRNGFFVDAIAFWTEALRTHSATVRPDVVSLTILLKAYIGIKEPGGIAWITKMLSVNQIIPDAHMKLILKNTRQQLRKRKLSPHHQKFLQAVEEAYAIFVLVRGDDLKDKMDARGKTLEIMERAMALDAKRSRVEPEEEVNNWDNFEEESMGFDEPYQYDTGPVAESSF